MVVAAVKIPLGEPGLVPEKEGGNHEAPPVFTVQTADLLSETQQLREMLVWIRGPRLMSQGSEPANP